MINKNKIDRQWKEDLLNIGVIFDIKQIYSKEGNEEGHFMYLEGDE